METEKPFKRKRKGNDLEGKVLCVFWWDRHCRVAHWQNRWWNRELTLKCKLKCYVKPMKDPLGVSPSKGNQGTTRGNEKILLTSVGIEPTTSRLDLMLLCWLSYEVGKRKSGFGWWIAAKRKYINMYPNFSKLTVTKSFNFNGLALLELVILMSWAIF